MKLTTRLLSVFLSIVLLFEVVPMQAFAAEQQIDGSSVQQEEPLPDETPEEHAESGSESAVILSEDIEKREETVKHFRMSDGTMQAAQYAEPVHFLQNGEWVDYDNTLTEVDADEEENAGRTILKNKDLINQTADYRVRLSKKTNGKKFVRIEKDGYKLSWYYVGANHRTANMERQSVDDGDPTTLEKLTTTVLYKDVFKATDFEYIIGSTGLKENLILKSQSAPREYTAEYKANGLTPTQIDDKTIELRAEDGTVIYTISAPCITDADGAYSDGVTLTLESVKNNAFIVKISLDTSWLDTKDRAYPVTVDPAIQTKQENSEMLSTFVESKHPSIAHGKSTNDMGSMYVGRGITEYETARTYIKVNTLPDIGGIGSKVIDARLSVCKRNVYSTTDKVQVNAYQVTSSWTANSLTYNNQPSHNSSIVDYMLFAADNKVQSGYQDGNGYSEFKTLEITDLVRGWYENTQSNYGIMLDTEATNRHKVWFFSIQYTTYPQTRPVLTVSYRNMSGYEDYWSYTNLSAGRGGSASVNNFTGNFVFSQPVTQGDGGNLMPVNLSLVFNANKGNPPYSHLGQHVQTNYHIYLRAESGELANNGYKYYLNDADGTKHWFFFANNSTTDGKDEDGLGYELKVITVGSDANDKSAKFVITDKEKNKMYFNASGNLTQIRNAAGISAKVSYETYNDETFKNIIRIKNITDGAGRVYTFQYVKGYPNHTECIIDPAGRKTKFSYTRDTLIKITFADGQFLQLSYNYDNYTLTEMKGIDGTRIKISYDSSAQKRVSQINYGASDTNLLEKYSFAYKQNDTTITDIQGRKYTYQFNNFGQTTGVVSNTDGSAQFFKLYAGNTTDSRANKLLQESRALKTVTNYAMNPGFTDGLTSYSKAIENTTGNPSITVDTTKGHLTRNALKIVKPNENVGYCSAIQTISGLPAGTYTFSCYVNTEGKTISGGGAYVGYKVLNADNTVLEEKKADFVPKTNGWERVSITFDLPQGKKARLVIGTEGNENNNNACGVMWFDDLQLEKSAGASSYNLIDNSALSNGMTSWKDNAALCNISDLPSFSKGVYLDKTKTSPSTKTGLFHRIFTNPGKKGDVFSFGSWVKGDSAPLNDLKKDDPHTPIFEVALHFYNASQQWLKKVTVAVNEDLNTWQFVSGQAIAPIDYDHIGIEIDYSYNVNAVYATGVFCFREEFGQTYTYDQKGNVVSAVDLAKTNSTFSYYGNQMSKMLNPSGSRYLYSYDDQKKLNFALSSDGQEYGFQYDDKGNVTKSEITARNPASEMEVDKEYIIVNAYSGKALDSGSTGNVSDDTYTSPYDPTSIYQHWKLASTETDGVYRIIPAAFPDKTDLCLDVFNNLNENGTIIQIHTWHAYPAQKFKITKEGDGTFTITTACSNFTKAIDAQYEEKDLDQKQIVKQKALSAPNNDESVKWYFYPVEKSDSRTIVTETSYTDSKNFVKNTKDQRGNDTSYVYNEQKGTLSSVTDALGRTTDYTYDANNNSLLSVSSGGMTNSYAYEQDRLKTIHVNGALQYQFAYDVFGRTTSTKVGNGTSFRTLSSMTYNNAGLLAHQTYGNGDYIDFTYDSLDRITQKQYNGSSTNRVKYLYGSDGSVAQTIDYAANVHTKFVYDLADRLVSQKEYTGTGINGGALRSSTDFTYADKTNYLTGIKHDSPLGTQNIGYRYGDLGKQEMPDQIYGVSWNGEEKLSYTYDGLGRLTHKTFTVSADQNVNKLDTQYHYIDVGEGARTTTLVESLVTKGITHNYTYDAVGNITSIYDGSRTISYVYDDLNQLVRVNDEYQNQTFTYAYENGNITFEHTYAYTTGALPATPKYSTQYHYEDPTWPDVLTGISYITYASNGTAVVSAIHPADASGASDALAKRLLGSSYKKVDLSKNILKKQANGVSTMSNVAHVDYTAIESDEIGNICAIDTFRFKWNGRQLQSVEDNGTPVVSYKYNADGQRISKTLALSEGEPVTTEYFYNGEILAGQKTGNDVLVFMYDNNGDIFGFTYNGEPYYYVKNAQNDVYLIVNSNCQAEVLYQYDAWGNITRCYDVSDNNLSFVNPITYRSYYYDLELGVYYLNSRYYAPSFHRFLNGDGLVDNRGLVTQNLFQYCGNNPVNNIDSNGNLFGVLAVLGLLAVGLLCMSGCGRKSAPAPTPSTTAPRAPTTSPSSRPLTNEQKKFVAVVAGEAGSGGTRARKAVAHTIMNRVKEPRDVWRNVTCVNDVLIKSQYNAVDDIQYNLAMDYLNNRDGSNATYEAIIAEVMPIYYGEEADFTGGAHYIFNIKTGGNTLERMLQKQPDRYVKCGPFDGISDEEYRMYRCLW